MVELKQFEAFGKQLVELGVSSKDLETRINGLNHEIEDPQIKAMVTGFVDALLGHEYREKESYELVHGFARFLYNGDFQDTRKRVLANFAKRSSKEDYELLRWLAGEKKDNPALDIIAESALETDPELTHAWYKNEKNRPAILRKIVETHRANDKFKDIVYYSLKDLKDTEGLRAFAKEYLAKDPSFAYKLLNESGTAEDWILAANTWKAKDIAGAYNAAVRACDKYPRPDEAEKLRAELKARFINEDPARALKVFHDRERRWSHDKETLITIGKNLLAKKELEGALEALSAAQYEGLELRDIGMTMLKRLEKDKKPSEHEYRPFSSVMSSAALAYLDNGGDIRTAVKYIPEHDREDGRDDGLRRKIGTAFAELPRKKDSENASNAYIRFIRIARKTDADEKMLDGLRERMLTNEDSYPESTFIGYHDHKGLRMLLEKKKKIKTEQLYNIARELNDAPLLEKTRRAIAADSVSHALYVFEQAKDDVGVSYVRESISHGIDPEVVQKIVPLGKKRD